VFKVEPNAEWMSKERKEMKKLHLAPYCVAFIVGNSILPSQIGRLADLRRFTYHQGLGGRYLPDMTVSALAMPLWFYACTMLSILACVGLFVQRVSVSVLVHLLMALSLLEGMALSYFALGICLPFAGIMWNIGK
jgi:hypothetical protein